MEGNLMNSYMLPISADERQVIIVLNDADIQSLSYEEGAASLISDPNTAIVKCPYSTENEIVNQLKNRQLFRRGAVLIQNPFKRDQYEDVVESREMYSIEKHMHFSEICCLLGARTIRVKQIEKKYHKRTNETKVKVEVGRVVKGSVETNDQNISKIAKSLTLLDEYSGSEPNVTGAIAVAERTSLIHDRNVRSLINICQNKGNRIKKRELELSLSCETERILDIVSSLDVPAYVNVNAEYKTIVQIRMEYNMSLLIEW